MIPQSWYSFIREHGNVHYLSLALEDLDATGGCG